MEGEIQHPPTQERKPSKTKSKSANSSVSQKAGVVKSIKPKNVGSVKVLSKGEGTGVSQPLQKDKVSEDVSAQPSHFVPSQKGTKVIRNQAHLKGVSIEKGPQPGTLNKGKDTSQTQPQPKMIERRKKPKTAGSQGTHTVVQSQLTVVIELLHKINIDVSPINVEKQSHSLSIPFPTPQSNISSSVAMIDNLIFSHSPSLQFREEPTLQTLNSSSRESSFLDLLNTDSPTIEKITKIFSSTDNITPTEIISSTDKCQSTHIPHPLIVPNVSMDIHQSMDNPSPTEIISQILLGLMEGSDLVSEGQVYNLEKGEDESERTPTSSGGTKGKLESSTLEGDAKGEQLSAVRFQDEILMQIVKETGTNEDLISISIDEQMQIANSMGIEVGGEDKATEFAAELTKELGLSSGGEEEAEAGDDEATRIAEGGMPNFKLDPNTFKHVNPAYQEIASSSNAEAEQVLGLVHTEGSLLHAKEVFKIIPEANEEEAEDYHAGEGGSVDSMSTDVGDDDEWLQVPSLFSLKDAVEDLK